MSVNDSNKKAANKHTMCYGDGKITVMGVTKVVQISERECVFRLDGQTLTLRGTGLTVTKLDRDNGTVALDVEQLSSVAYRNSFGGGLKGLFS